MEVTETKLGQVLASPQIHPLHHLLPHQCIAASSRHKLMRSTPHTAKPRCTLAATPRSSNNVEQQAPRRPAQKPVELESHSMVFAPWTCHAVFFDESHAGRLSTASVGLLTLRTGLRVGLVLRLRSSSATRSPALVSRRVAAVATGTSHGRTSRPLHFIRNFSERPRVVTVLGYLPYAKEGHSDRQLTRCSTIVPRQ